MADEHEKLRHTLDQLQSQLEEMRKLNPAVAESLQATIVEAREVLHGQPTVPVRHRSIIERLRQEVQKYEASHPSLAANLGSVIDALGQMGI
jgi:chorismate mutase